MAKSLQSLEVTDRESDISPLASQVDMRQRMLLVYVVQGGRKVLSPCSSRSQSEWHAVFVPSCFREIWFEIKGNSEGIILV